MTIREMKPEEIPACAELIRTSFRTVAEEFDITPENAPRFTAFAVNEERLRWQLFTEKRPMFTAWEGETPAGYCSLLRLSDGAWELNNLCTHPDFRHHGIGGKLLQHAEHTAKRFGGKVMQLGIVEENQRLRRWYEAAGYRYTGTKKFDFFPFTCGYLEKAL